MNFIYAGKEIDNDTINRINLLLSTPKGTMPNDREYGIDMSFLDNPINVSESLFVIEASYALDRYEKNITIESAEFTVDKNGEISAKINIVESVNEDDDDIDDYYEYEEEYEEVDEDE